MYKNLFFVFSASVVLTLASSAAVITVTTADNANPGTGKSLVKALQEAGAGDTIAFNIPGDGPHYIVTPPDGYPLIRQNNLTLDGYTQPGASPNTNPLRAANNAKLRIVLDSREGGRTKMNYETGRPGYGDSEKAILGIFNAANVTIRGLCLLGLHTANSNDDPGIYCIALARDHTGEPAFDDNAHISGCWFGVEPDGTSVTGGSATALSFFRHRDISGGPLPELPNRNLTVGVKAGSTNPRAEFNIMLDMEYHLAGEAIGTRLSGNFIGVLPDGKTHWSMVDRPFAGASLEIGRYNDSTILIGTDGDGVNDTQEGNIFGTPKDATPVLSFYGTGNKSYIVAGNNFGLGVDGVTRFPGSYKILDEVGSTASTRIGSDFDGVSDDCEANRIANNTPFDPAASPCACPGRKDGTLRPHSRIAAGMQSPLSIQQVLAQPDNTQLIEQLLRSDAVLTRTDLARELCRRLDLRDPKGNDRLSTTRKALRDLETQGFWTLPTSTVSAPQGWNPTRLNHPVKAPTAVPKSVEDISGLQLVEVTTEEGVKIWNELMIREHPLHECRLVGRQLRYLVASDHGYLGGIGFGSAALYLEGRDDWIGWDSSQRVEHLPRVLNMNRFLIRPRVHCENLASHVLSLCTRRVAGDFERRYGVRPWLLESFVDRSTYDGACYKAANWIGVGQTKGRGRNGTRKEGKSIKDIYLYALVDDVPGRMGVEPPVLIALDSESGLSAQGWAEQEFGDCDLGDPRRTRRLVKIVREQSAQPSGSYSQAAGGNRHQLKGYYRFLNNPREELDPEGLLQTHRTQTIRRMKKEKTVLILQDTTELNFTARPGCEGLGQLGSNQTGAKSRGLDLHSCLAVGGISGLPLGVLRLHGYAPQPAKGKDPRRPIEEKESYRWLQAYEDAAHIAAMIPETRVISVADREGDMFELFDHRRGLPGKKAELLVRAKWDRSLEGTDEKLFEELAAAPLAKRVTLSVPRQREHLSKPSTPGRPALAAREAKVEVRFKEVTINPPQKSKLNDKPPLKLWAIYVEEKNPPVGATPVRWMLLTTIAVVSVKQALRCVKWYCRRWRIEEWHRVMKSGCKILEHQNHSAEVLQRAIAIDAVIAWRIMLLALLGREVPELPSQILFDRCECEVLELLTQEKKLSLGEAMIAIAQLGGYLNRKCDGPPGFECLWKGYARFHDMVKTIRLRSASKSKRR